MRVVRDFAAFVYDFVVGDDPMIAVAVALGLGGTALLDSAGIPAWWVVPVLAGAALAISLLRATREPS